VPGKKIGAGFIAAELSGEENADHFLRHRGRVGGQVFRICQELRAFAVCVGSQPVRHADAGIAGREIPGVSGHQKHRACLRCGPDNGVGQLDVMVAAKVDGALCNLAVKRNDIEGAQKAASRICDLAGSDPTCGSWQAAIVADRLSTVAVTSRQVD
jgi:hypothetical protein